MVYSRARCGVFPRQTVEDKCPDDMHCDTILVRRHSKPCGQVAASIPSLFDKTKKGNHVVERSGFVCHLTLHKKLFTSKCSLHGMSFAEKPTCIRNSLCCNCYFWQVWCVFSCTNSHRAGNHFRQAWRGIGVSALTTPEISQKGGMGRPR